MEYRFTLKKSILCHKLDVMTSKIVMSQKIPNCDITRYLKDVISQTNYVFRYHKVSQIEISQTSYDFEISIIRFCNV